MGSLVVNVLHLALLSKNSLKKKQKHTEHQKGNDEEETSNFLTYRLSLYNLQYCFGHYSPRWRLDTILSNQLEQAYSLPEWNVKPY